MVKSCNEPTPETIGIFAPLPFDIEATKAEWMQDPEFRTAYEALADEFTALDALLAARRAAGLTQAEVADRMGIKSSALARIEDSLGRHRHSPPLKPCVNTPAPAASAWKSASSDGQTPDRG
jgi:DNA-binding XRE family transcriptional regulator